MGIVSRRFQGFLHDPGRSTRADLLMTPRPHINARVRLNQRRLEIPLLIDTGADFTFLQPAAAARLLEVDELRHQPTQSADVITLSGIGGGVRTMVRQVGLLIWDDSGVGYSFSQSILLGLPGNSSPSAPSPIVPSLLGRDVLRRFDLHLSYDPPSVSLTLDR